MDTKKFTMPEKPAPKVRAQPVTISDIGMSDAQETFGHAS
jgi:hypothetical protein